MPDPLTYGEFTPTAAIQNNAGKSWPLSWPLQRFEVARHLRRLLEETGHDPVAGVQVLVHWNDLTPTIMRVYYKDFGDGVLRECFDEFRADTQQRITTQDPERDGDAIRRHVKRLHAKFGIRPQDKPPVAPAANGPMEGRTL